MKIGSRVRIIGGPHSSACPQLIGVIVAKDIDFDRDWMVGGLGGGVIVTSYWERELKLIGCPCDIKNCLTHRSK